MLEYIIGIFGIATLLIWVYEAIILPQIRMALRYDLFELRDSLRRWERNRRSKNESKEYRYVQESINNSIALLRHINVSTIYKIWRLSKEDANLQKVISLRKKAQDRLSDIDVEFKRIRDELMSLSAKILLFNNLVFMIPVVILVLLPGAMVLCLFKGLSYMTSLVGKVSNWGYRFVALPEGRADELRVALC